MLETVQEALLTRNRLVVTIKKHVYAPNPLCFLQLCCVDQHPLSHVKRYY